MRQAIENAVPFPIAARRHIVDFFEAWCALAKETVDLRLGPDVELAFLMFAVGIEAAGEVAFGRQHLACDPIDRLGDTHGVETAVGLLPDERQKIHELGIVVEHLFEMRHEPARVDAVTRIAAADVIIDAALRDMIERELDRMPKRFLSQTLPAAPKEIEQTGLRKFRSEEH